MATSGAPKNKADLEKLLEHDSKVKLAGIDVDGVFRGKASLAFIYDDRELKPIADRLKGQVPVLRQVGRTVVLLGHLRMGTHDDYAQSTAEHAKQDIHDQTYTRELGISNLANGYRDITARIDLSTFRRIPWEQTTDGRGLPFFLLTFYDPDTDRPLHACPRGTLQVVLEKLKAQTGMEAYAGAEFEYFQFDETPATAAEKGFKGLQALTPGMHGYSVLRTSLNQEYYHDIFDMCEQFEVPIEGHHTETGPGVFETALAYTSAMRMADNAALFKLTAKNVGIRHKITPSFMAKPYNDLPGCSGHIHISLVDPKTGKNAFAAPTAAGREGVKYSDAKHISQEAEHFVAGVLKGLRDIMPCLAPNVNSYKRLVEGFWAATSVSWGYESRLASVRVISAPLSSPEATRLEVRVPGADMNPHFAFSAIIACGMYGMEHKLELDTAPITPDNAKDLEPLPRTLQEATQAFKKPDSMARKVLGDAFVDHFAGTREHEWRLFAQTVTNWELERYLELA